jgi:hypothetical protein
MKLFLGLAAASVLLTVPLAIGFQVFETNAISVAAASMSWTIVLGGYFLAKLADLEEQLKQLTNSEED